MLRLCEAGASFEYLKAKLCILRVHKATDSSSIDIGRNGLKGCQVIWRALLARRAGDEGNQLIQQRLKDMQYKIAVNPEK